MRRMSSLQFLGTFAIAAMLGAASAWASGDQVYAFQGGASGAEPLSSLLAVGDRLYGTTAEGGNTTAKCNLGCGTVFWINPKTGEKRVVYAFQGGSDGTDPDVGLINVGGILYGTTTGGGPLNFGTIFAFDPMTNKETNLYSFQGGSDGLIPEARLLNLNGTLYGTTSGGGISDAGTVFSFNLTSNLEMVVYAFKGKPDGAKSYADLIDVAGMLYGTTNEGGSKNRGTIFSLDPVTGVESVLHSFEGHPDGAFPQAGLIKVEGTLFGATASGGSVGSTGFGAIVSLDLATLTEEVVFSFNNTDGFSPSSDLINVSGTLYGTTQDGGAVGLGNGAVFSLDLAGRTETTVYSFQGGSDGNRPYASVIDVGGILYGTTWEGGNGPNSSGLGDGTVFAVTP